MVDLPLKCTCGNVQGVARDVTSRAGTRAICYCDDCQAFARHLDHADKTLDTWGGTDVLQLPRSRIAFTRGSEHIRCIKLKASGMYRWYAGCCRTPIGNTLSASWPFIGIVVHRFIDVPPEDRDRLLGPVRGYVFTKFAGDSLPNEYRKRGTPPALLFRGLSKIFIWKLKGLGNPSPFFDDHGKPASEPVVLG